ncbi:predicted protein [Naegleria gruberi]|uniref:Predicted protein n=1 Tax=Naegleria gruberi TaxID=5762 RepID=D2VTM6_NAEGR|nr:uncharacterized protein NAEGRDRAFT_72357 [Naegleria gruberi]EFC39887.1 predicted protein [Naegleria gruberi]|eukprot:XP_002672631.1 predicted protein [Naegleria gruberi strain NEG-M]
MTRRIVPENAESSWKASQKEEVEEEEQLLVAEKKEKRPLILGILLSVRLFLIIVIMSVVLLTALSIWITSYKVNQDQAMEAVNVLISNIREKVSNFLNSQLVPAKQVAQQMAYDYHNKYVKIDDSALPYVFSKMRVYNITLANLCYGEGGLNAMQAVTVDETKGSFVWAKKNPGENFLTWILDSDTGAVVKSYGLILPAYPVGKMDYYVESLSLFQNYPQGAFGNVYQVINSSMQTFFSVPIYNTTNTTSKQRLGISKVNISLTLIGKFLASVEVLTRGFVIVSEFNTDYVIGSSLDIPELLLQRIHSVNISQHNAGEIMRKFHELSGKVETFQTTLTIGQTTYLISSSAYVFENIKWRMTLVFEESEIMEGIIVSSYIILGVTVGVCLLGILISVLIGNVVTNPFVQLEKDFKKIEMLDLANIKPRSSLFSEAANIYACLTATVQWLKDFKSFLPDSVLNQLSDSNNDTCDKDKDPPGDSSLRESASAINLSNRKSETQSRISSHHDKKRDMFKLGLSVKECCVVNVRINNMNEKYFSDPDVLSQTISKVLTGISTICKTVRADLQIKSYDEFLVIFADRPQVSNIGLETALKIVAGIGHLNDNLTRNGHGKLINSIGIASGNSLQGNVGNKQTRYFALVGTVIERAKDLCFMSSQFETPVLTDQITFKHEAKLQAQRLYSKCGEALSSKRE